MQVDIFLLQRGLESRTTCSQAFLQNVSVESYTLSGCTTSTQLPLKFNELLTHCWPFISRYTGQVLKLELCRVMSRNTPLDARAGKYFAVNFRREKECELNIPFEKYIGIIDLSAELPECWINLPPQTNSIQFNLTFDYFHMNRYGVYLGVRTCELFLRFAPFVFLRSIVLTSLFPLFYVTCEFNRFY